MRAGSTHDEVREVEVVMGACMLVRREAVDQVGPLDESFFLFSEETDWCYRFGEAGWKVLFFPGAECVHVGGASHGGRMFRENVRGHLRFLAKHRGVRYAERARRLLGLSLRAACAAVPRRARAHVPRRGRLACVGAHAGAARAMTLLRLALATGVLLLPGAVVARALGLRGASVTLAWSLTLLFGALAVTFLAGASLTLTLLLLLGAGVAALPFVRRAPRPERIPGRWWVLGAGAVLGVLLWHVAGEIGGDGLFHLARVRKLEAFDSLSLGAVEEFADGGPHPGYAFPLWHGFLALVARVSFLDPSEVVLHEASVLAPLALLVAYEAGYALFRRVGPAVAVVCAQVGVTAFAPAHGGAYTALALPATASRQLLVPAALALALAYVERPNRQCLPRSPVRDSSWQSSIRPTRSFSGCPSRASSSSARSWRGRSSGGSQWRSPRSSLPAAAFFVWLLPVIRDTASHAPGRDELQRAFTQYAGQLDVFSDTSYRLAPEVFGRAGAIAIAALLFVPLAGLALRRRWAAYVLGGFLAVAAVMLFAPLFVQFSDLVSISQSRRAAGFWPLSFAFAGGFAVLAALLRGLVLPLALAGGIVLQLAYPGEFDYALHEGGPALVTWFAVVGGVVALGIGLWRRPAVERPGAVVGLAAALFVLPVAVHAAANWSPSPARIASPLTPGLVEALREDVPKGDVVYSDLETSYRIAAEAPVYIAAAPPGHVADTEENRPFERRAENIRFFRTGDVAIPRRAGAGWLVLDRRRFDIVPQLDSVYRDDRYTLYVIP